MSQSHRCDSCFAFGEARYLDGGSSALDSQYRAFLFVQDGLATIRGHQGDDELRAGECAFYAGDYSFAIRYPSGISTHLLWCKTLLPGVRIKDYAVSASSSHIAASQELQKFFRLGLQLATNTSTSANRLRDAIGEAIVGAYFEGSAEWPRAGIPVFLLEARDYADRYFSEPCDLTRLADTVGVTPQYLVSAFRKHFGITPVRYVWELRARRAASLVRETRLGLPDIAEKCGYKSHYHMSREIKRITGVSPRGLRL
jgi:AraC-like DNA-binding protein